MFKKEKDENILGIKKGELLFSNSAEVLLEHLKVNLFSAASGLFSEHLLITPSAGMHQWIKLQIASTLSISCGYTATYLDKGVDFLCKKLFSIKKGSFFPNQIELFLKIEQAIDEALLTEDPIWLPLVQYIQKKESRKLPLIQYLSELFKRYSIYANSAVEEWERRPSNWQQALWAKIFCEWDYPRKVLPALETKREIPEGISVHLFAFSHLSPLHLNFFCKISRLAPVYFYQLSPCQEFWSDLPAEHPSILGSMGKVGREMARLIEEQEIEAHEAYIFFGGKSQLRQLQRDLLTLQTTETIVEDDSVEIHVLSTKYQEIENLFARLCIFFKESKLEPKDVIVMAPKITDYASYIQAVFGDKIPYQLADLPFSLSHPLAKGLFLIFDLEKKRWSAPAILELLGNPLFSKKMHFTEDDLIIIRSWVQKTGIRWGLDGKHRGELLKKAHCKITLSDPAATWMEGLSYLLEELAFPQNSERIQIFQAELLGDLIVLLQNLRKTVEELETTKTIDQWVVFLKNCVETFFFLEDEADGFFSHIERIKQAGRHFPRQAYRFPTIYTLLKNLLSSEAVILNKNNHQTVHFCSMLPMRAIPAKVICLIGMQHDAFPRKEELQTLDLLKQGDYFPSRIDFDRYLFLEAILSAREKLIISYIGRDPFDHTELPPSSLVAELLPSLSPKCIHHHIKYDLSKIPLQPLPSFSIQVPPSFNRPTGEVIVELDDFIRAFRSPLNHFLRSQDIYFYEDELIQHDEPFILSPLKKASLKNEALLHSPEEALKKGDREGIFPLGLLGDLAKRQLLEEMAAFAHLKVNKVSFLFEPLHLDPSLTIIFRGNIPNVFSNGLYIPEKCTFKQAAKIWPYFLLLNYQDPAKQEVVFGLSNDLKQAFFNDPRPFLITCVDFYLKAKQFPFYWALDWLEPILKKNVHKLMHSQVYDLPLKWQLKGRERIDYSALIETYHPIIKGLYGEMADAWF